MAQLTGYSLNFHSDTIILVGSNSVRFRILKLGSQKTWRKQR